MLMQVSGCYWPMLVAVRGIQPGKRDPVQPPCGRCSGVVVRLQVSDPYEILQATVEIVRGSVHAEGLGRCHRVHATACRGVPQLPSHRLQRLHGLGAHVTSRTPSSPRPLYALLRLYRSGVGLSLLVSCGYARIGESVEPVRGKAGAWVSFNVSTPQQLLEQGIELALFGLQAYAARRSPH